VDKIKWLETVELMAQNEDLTGSLYDIFAEKFTVSGHFWRKLAKEERGHAQILRWMASRIVENNGACEGVFSIEAARFLHKYLLKNIDQAKNQDIALVFALSIALDLENSLLEKDYFKVVDADSQEFKRSILKLVDDTKRHEKLIREMQLSLAVKG